MWLKIDAGCNIVQKEGEMHSPRHKAGLSREQTQANYDRLSPFYDLLAGSSERACRAAGLELLAAGPGERGLVQATRCTTWQVSWRRTEL
jgi:hypothetical protein